MFSVLNVSFEISMTSFGINQLVSASTLVLTSFLVQLLFGVFSLSGVVENMSYYCEFTAEGRIKVFKFKNTQQEITTARTLTM